MQVSHIICVTTLDNTKKLKFCQYQIFLNNLLHNTHYTTFFVVVLKPKTQAFGISYSSDQLQESTSVRCRYYFPEQFFLSRMEGGVFTYFWVTLGIQTIVLVSRPIRFLWKIRIHRGVRRSQSVCQTRCHLKPPDRKK